MIPSQSSAQPVASLYSGTETGIKRIVPHRGSASGFDPPRSSPEAEPRLLMKNPTERKYSLVSTAFTAESKDIGRLITASRLNLMIRKRSFPILR
jgi:hypothetical protein